MLKIRVFDEKNNEKILTVNKAITGYELLTEYALFKKTDTVLAYLLDGVIQDLHSEIKQDGTVKYLFKNGNDNDSLTILNYTMALVLAYTVQVVYPQAIVALASSDCESFYVDVDSDVFLKKDNLELISEKMATIMKDKIIIKRILRPLNAIDTDNIYILDYIKRNIDYQQEKTFYSVNNKLLLLATGVAISATSMTNAFTLTSVTGAYWNGDIKNKQLQRIAGVAHWSQKELQQLIQTLTLRKNADHRTIGKKMNIFMFSDEIGKGLPIFLPNGMIIKKELQQYLREKEFEWDYQEVSSPILGLTELYKKSGHWDHYQENMFKPFGADQEEFVLRPMTCPHHCMIYKSRPYSYRDLPVRFSEHALLYRYESSGALTGLERVRAMELTDTHIFARSDQIKSEFKRCYQLISEVLAKFKIAIDYLSLSLRDPNDKDKYYNDDKMWDYAENSLREVLDELQLPYKEMIGEAAFYGPKFDVQIKTTLGHEVTISTIQLDFLLPQKFALEYKNQNGVSATPIIIHRGLIGTYERFVATLIEQTQGVFPLFLAPKQVVVIPVVASENILEYSSAIVKALKKQQIRAHLAINESFKKRIKLAHEEKIPYVVIVGENEVKNEIISYHTYKKIKTGNLSLPDFINQLKIKIANRNFD